jgi:hypothetical protein
MGEHLRTFRRNVLAEPDHARRLQQGRQCRFAGFERHAAQIAAVILQQIEGVEHGNVTAAPAAQRLETGEPVPTDHDRLAVEREALSFQPSRAFCDPRSRAVQSIALRLKSRTPSPSRRTIIRYPSCLISCTQSAPEGGAARSTGWAGTTNPAGNLLRNIAPELVYWLRRRNRAGLARATAVRPPEPPPSAAGTRLLTTIAGKSSLRPTPIARHAPNDRNR